MNRSLIKKWGVAASLIGFLALGAFGQDLGSSNKLFGKPAKSSSTKKTTTKKPTAKAPARSKKAAKPVTISNSKKVKTKRSTAKTPVKTKPATSQASKVTKKDETPKVDIKPSMPKTEVKTPPVETATASISDEEFESIIVEGNNAREIRDLIGAEMAYKRARTLRPHDARSAYGLGNIYSDQQRWEDAEAYYRTALQVDPGSAISHVALSYVLTQPVLVANLSERYAEAERLARKAIQYAPSNALAFDQLGVSMELRGLIDSETENAYRRAISLDSRFAPAYAHLGRLLRRRGQVRESDAAYEDAIRRANSVAAMVLVADVMQSEQRYADSEKLLSKALSADPKNFAGLLMQGRALTALSRFDEAESTLKRCVNASQNSFQCNSVLSGLYLRQGKLELAENALLQALRDVSTLGKLRLASQFEKLGDAYGKDGKVIQAERSYKQATTLDPENSTLDNKVVGVKR